MATDRSDDLRAFRGFIDQQLDNGGNDLSLEEALARWEYENSPEEEREETLRAIQRGLDDMNAGRTVDAFEFAERMRQKFQPSDKQ
jgi:predicted transcriptional regulator